jgi:filamentous hemagglutinin family protein
MFPYVLIDRLVEQLFRRLSGEFVMSAYHCVYLKALLKSCVSIRWLAAAISGTSAVLVLPLLVSPAFANPLTGTVTTGSASIGTIPNKTQINQKSEDVVIDWSSFNIGAGQTTQFVQPNAQAIAVNRIGGNAASQILGTLDANGRIVLINGNGMLFGNGSQVNVGSLIATSTGGSDSDVLSGKFTQAGNQNAAVVNQGSIRASLGGLVALVAPSVTNSGTVNAKFGTVAFGAANKFTVGFTGDGLVSFATQGDVNGRAMATNTGSLVGANVSLTARAAEGLATGIVYMSGTVAAQSAHQVGGTIVLDAGDGGSIAVSHAELNASGTDGGGSISIGGWNQNSVVVDKASILNASATSNGNGGSISVIALANSFEGRAWSQGGAVSGSGGAIETSGRVVDTQGAQINALAAHGSTGSWSLDPENITISTSTSVNGSISDGIFTPSGDNSVLNVGKLEKALKTVSVDVETGGVGSPGAQAGDITVVAPLAWMANTTLTLDAYHSILIDSAISMKGATAGLDLITNDGGAGGSVSFNNGNVNFARTTGQLTIDGDGYSLIDSIAGLAAAIAANPAGDYALSKSISSSAIYNKSPIGAAFTGILDGLGNEIASLQILDKKSGQNVGLFAEQDGTVEWLGLSDVNVTGILDVGSFAGSSSGGVFIGDFVTGTVIGINSSARGFIGGMVGTGNFSINNSYSDANVTGGNYSDIGGMTGNGGVITDSYATGSATGGTSSYVGGLAGENATISGSYAAGAVTTGNSSGIHGVSIAGGLEGISGGLISNSYATGAVTGGAGSEIGGLEGYAGVGLVVTNSYATGQVSGGKDAYVGGLVGYFDASIVSDTYATGAVSGAGGSYVGGLVGLNFTGQVNNSFATGSVSGTGRDADGHAVILGGLVGYNDAVGSNGIIDNSYATGSVTATDSRSAELGGLVGLNSGSIESSYSTGLLTVSSSPSSYVGGLVGFTESPYGGAISDSYWATDSSGISNGSQGAGNVLNVAGIVGMTTAQLQSDLPAGFDPTVWGESASINGGLPYLLSLAAASN